MFAKVGGEPNALIRIRSVPRRDALHLRGQRELAINQAAAPADGMSHFGVETAF
jgi:hypothetical protein